MYPRRIRALRALVNEELAIEFEAVPALERSAELTEFEERVTQARLEVPPGRRRDVEAAARWHGARHDWEISDGRVVCSTCARRALLQVLERDSLQATR